MNEAPSSNRQAPEKRQIANMAKAGYAPLPVKPVAFEKFRAEFTQSNAKPINHGSLR